MLPFLHETAQNIIQKYTNDLPNLCLVFPNKRAGYFFKKYFAQELEKTSWSPTILTIETYIKRQTGLTTVDKLSLLFDLHQIFKRISNDKEVYSFDKFFSLGEIILADFSDIDSYLTDVKQIYTNIHDLKDIDSQYDYLSGEQKEIISTYWRNFSPEKQSKEKEHFLRLWKLLPDLYFKFTDFLLSKKIAYSGLQYRELARLVETNTLPSDRHKKIIFIGFNALNKSQKKLFELLKNTGKADFYWNTDTYYQNDMKQEAGDFLRYNLSAFSDKDCFIPSNFAQKRKIRLIGMPLEVGQAKAIPTILENMGIDLENEEDLQKTAIVLANEHLLFPVLHSLPSEISKINVTMGYPLKDTALYSLIELYLNLQISESKYGYYHQHVLSILRHPYLQQAEADNCKMLIEWIEKANLVHVGFDALLSYKSELIQFIFTPVREDGQLLLSNILNYLFVLFTQNQVEEKSESQRLEDEYIYQVYIQIKRLHEVLESKAENFNNQMIIRLLYQMLNSVRIPFSGEMIDGIQVMGVMETRNLDFENVIVLGLNEGIFPNLSRAPSFISESLRHAFDLPVIKQQDAIFSYFFYSLLSRASKITLAYNNITGYEGAGEQSRFIKQLLYESPHEIEDLQFQQDLLPVEKSTIEVEKSLKVLAALDEFKIKDGKSARSLYASGITSYMECSLRFYFQYIAKLRKPDGVEEEISPAVFGSILHKTLEIIYDMHIQENDNQTISPNDFDSLHTRLDAALDDAFKDSKGIHVSQKYHYRNNEIVIREVLKKHAKTILRYDKKIAPFDIVQLEGRTNFDISLQVDDFEVGLSGVIDRIDKIDGIYRILDYKTGKVNKAFKSVAAIFDPENKKTEKTIIQSLLYALLFVKQERFSGKLCYPGIYNVQEMKQKTFQPKLTLKGGKSGLLIDHEEINNLLTDYEVALAETISDIFNPDISFSQAEDVAKCKYCNFKELCNR